MNYVLSKEAENDIRQIYFYGVNRFGEAQADKYFEMLFECFQRISENPFLYPSAAHIREGYRYAVCGVETIYFKLDEKGNC